MLVGGIANILHRDTLAVLVGSRLFDRGERCFTEGRVIKVQAGRGELAGAVRPQEAGRAPYWVRIWVRDEGLAYECSCPMGEQREFCKHTVAIALAHLENERRDAERALAGLRAQLLAIGAPALVEALIQRARNDASLRGVLQQIGERK